MISTFSPSGFCDSITGSVTHAKEVPLEVDPEAPNIWGAARLEHGVGLQRHVPTMTRAPTPQVVDWLCREALCFVSGVVTVATVVETVMFVIVTVATVHKRCS